MFVNTLSGKLRYESRESRRICNCAMSAAGSCIGPMMDRRKLVCVIAGGMLAAPFASFAQTQAKVWRIGVLETTPATMNAANLDAFRQGLKELGYIEGRNVVTEYRTADNVDAKRVALLKEAVPGLARVGALLNLDSPANPPLWKDIETAARSLGVQAELFDVRKPEDLASALSNDGLPIGR